VWTWGLNHVGQLGDQTITAKSSPVLLVGNHSFAEIAGGYQQALARKADGSVWTWGSNANGALGAHVVGDRSSPVLVVGGHSFTQIVGAGTDLCAARKADGSVWAWGDNTNGGVGDQTTTAKSSPTLVVGAHSFVHLTGGSSSLCGLKADGTAWTWGLATSGQLGDQTVTAKSSPVLVVGPVTFATLDGGHLFYAGIQGVPPVAGGSALTTRGFFFGA
jgi:alpha-tubulin suppressor-like RCC1 family protein